MITNVPRRYFVGNWATPEEVVYFALWAQCFVDWAWLLKARPLL